MPPEAPRSSPAPRDSDPARPRGGSEEGRSETGQQDPRFARVLIGVGNPYAGDDGAGRAVARRLIDRKDCAFEVRECAGEATSLMSAWTGCDDVVLVDACRGAGPPGSVHRIGPGELDRLACLQHASTHSLGVAAAIGLARALGTLPGRLVIHAIEAGHASDGEGLSPEVDRAVDEVVALVMQDSHV
jgi:hydrogenase maturation protease